jgi:hypothetical protein
MAVQCSRRTLQQPAALKPETEVIDTSDKWNRSLEGRR